jgi:lipid-binding SYLF domain-containing protein
MGKSSLLVLLVLSLMTPFIGGCSTAPKSEEGKANLHDDAQAALERFKREDSSLSDLLAKANGYAVLPSIAKGAWVVGGAYGKGEVYEAGNMVGFTDMTQASVGFQWGGQEYAELLVFNTPQALADFKNNKLELGANASAIAVKAGAGGTAKFENGVATFIMPKVGAMVEASVGGQRFTYKPAAGM